jgi:hypothetical protein
MAVVVVVTGATGDTAAAVTGGAAMATVMAATGTGAMITGGCGRAGSFSLPTVCRRRMYRGSMPQVTMHLVHNFVECCRSWNWNWTPRTSITESCIHAFLRPCATNNLCRERERERDRDRDCSRGRSRSRSRSRSPRSDRGRSPARDRSPSRSVSRGRDKSRSRSRSDRGRSASPVRRQHR